MRIIDDEAFAKNVLKEQEHISYALKYFIDRTRDLEREVEFYKNAYENRVNEYLKINKED